MLCLDNPNCLEANNAMKKIFLSMFVCIFLTFPAEYSDAISVSLDNGGNNIGSGDSLKLSIGVGNNGIIAVADAYLILISPDGTPIFFEYSANGLAAHIATYDPATWKKFLSNVAFSGVFDTGPISILNYKFSGNEPEGNYQTIFALTKAGTFTVLDAKSRLFHVSNYPVASLVGTYRGSWTNNTFGSTGSVLAKVDDSSPGIITITITLGGTVGGVAAPPPFTETLTLNSQGGIINGGSAQYGAIKGTFTTDGKFQGTVTEIPGGVIKSAAFSGTLSRDSLSLNFTISFVSGASATGTTFATRQ